jgi:hypothetical protein
MGTRLNILAAATGLALICGWANSAFAVVTTGPGGSGVTVGNSGLIGQFDLSDTFRGAPDGSSNPLRVYVPMIQGPGAYVLENTHGNLSRSWTAGFSFASDGAGDPGFVNGNPAYPGNPALNNNTSGSGSGTGFTQTGSGVDYGTPFGLRNRYVAQFDAVQVADRIDITSSNTQGTIFGANSLSVFFRPTGHANEIGLFNGAVETPTGLTTGAALGTWNNYAVAFDRPSNSIEIFVNEVSRGTINLNTFAGGIYANYGNGNINFGAGLAGGENRTWTDNAQVGTMASAAVPGPASLVTYINFDESASGTGIAYDQVHANNGTFTGASTRTTGLLGTGAANITNAAANGVNIGNGQNGVNNLFSFTSGITVEALFSSTTLTNNQHEFFRKEDGNNRILLSLQSDTNTNNAFGQFVGGADQNLPGISFGLNVNNAYAEMDVELDGLDGRPTLADINDGALHHIVATYDAATGLKSIYIDGDLIGQVDLADNLNIVSGGAANAFIGSSGGGSEPFSGTLDEFAIYNRALSPDEIAAHFANVSAGLNYFAAVPEPASFGVWGFALAATGGLGWWKLRRRK